jgi:hypothetical protein
VPARVFGRQQEIEIGHYSGRSNVLYWLRAHGYEPSDELVDRVFNFAKQQNHTLSTDEVKAVIGSVSRPRRGGWLKGQVSRDLSFCVVYQITLSSFLHSRARAWNSSGSTHFSGGRCGCRPTVGGGHEGDLHGE